MTRPISRPCESYSANTTQARPMRLAPWLLSEPVMVLTPAAASRVACRLPSVTPYGRLCASAPVVARSSAAARLAVKIQ
ncbi:Uncharacterised protein [Bordetella pertussis]|nr:Uncharacterised protein [Bordetella pertussis]